MPPANPFEDWIGGERVASDTVTLDRARKLAATLDRKPDALAAGDPLPRGWHWIYFHEPVRRSALAKDGHERRGDFLPPISLPRRMWAGGRVRFHEDVPIGGELRRTSTVRSVELKEGRSGRLAFVTVEHRHSTRDGAPVIEEEQDLVYLERSEGDWTPGPRRPPPEAVGPGQAEARRLDAFTPDEVTLFRFSALTFNGHRIHFDRRFARDVEGYPDLVVHGPLLALLLLEAGDRLMRSGNAGGANGPVRFEYRALQPLFGGETVQLWARTWEASDHDGGVQLWAEHPTRGVVTRARLGKG